MRNFAFWYQPLSSGGVNYEFSAYGDDVILFSTLQTSVKSQISTVQTSIGSDNSIILRKIVDRLLSILDITNTTDFTPIGTTSTNYSVTYTYIEGNNPPISGGYSIYTFNVNRVSDNALVSNGELTVLKNDSNPAEGYIVMNVNINVVWSASIYFYTFNIRKSPS
jgi:hypothetical protein